MAACGDSSSSMGEKIEEAFLRSYRPYLDVPVRGLRGTTLEDFSSRLDYDIPGVQNWKYMAEILNFSNNEVKYFENAKHKAATAIEAWTTRSTAPATLGDLLTLVHAIVGRKDIFTDEILQQKIIRDAQSYLLSQNGRCVLPTTASFSWDPSLQSGLPSSKTSYGFCPSSFSSFFHSINTTTPPQQYPDTTTQSPPSHRLQTPSADEVFYDAYLFYGRVDGFILDELIPRLNNEGIKYYLPENLPTGLNAYEASMAYMLNRCAKILILLSDEVLQTRQAVTLGNINQQNGFEPGRLIPVRYKSLSSENGTLATLTAVDFTNTLNKEWCWDKIIKGIKRSSKRVNEADTSEEPTSSVTEKA